MNFLVCQICIIVCFFCLIHGQVGYYVYQNYQPFPFIPFSNYPNNVPIPMAFSAQSAPQQPALVNHRPIVKHVTTTDTQPFYGERCFFPKPLNQFNPESAQQVKPSKPVKLDYGNCPELEPKEEDKKMEEEKMKECLKDLEMNENSTIDDLTMSQHAMINQCLLRKQELLNDAGKYQYDKAMEKLKGKGLPEEKQKKLDEAHVECKLEAESKFFDSVEVLAPVHLYNKCMDFHIKMLCDVKEHVPKKATKPQFFRDNSDTNNNLDILSRSIGSIQAS